MGARKIILINHGQERLERVLRDFGDERTVGIVWDDDVVAKTLEAGEPFNEPHIVMVNASAEPGYRLTTQLMV
jgi:threonine dehydrogenase-like Zn-dependent dehydrogenase